MKFGIIGSGSWGTALAKILTDNNNSINWWIRSETIIEHFKNAPSQSTIFKFCLF